MNLTKQDLVAILWHAKSSIQQTTKDYKIENLLEPSEEAQQKVQRMETLLAKVTNFHDKAFDLWADQVASDLREAFKKRENTNVKRKNNR